LKAPFEKLVERLREKKKSYQGLFGNLLEADALRDLAWFCHAHHTTADMTKNVNHERMLILEGRRQVWLRISEMLNLEPDEIVQLYTSAIRHGDR
jgi:hypothetical protein